MVSVLEVLFLYFGGLVARTDKYPYWHSICEYITLSLQKGKYFCIA
jgi:hypothetical protein